MYLSVAYNLSLVASKFFLLASINLSLAIIHHYLHAYNFSFK